MKALFETARLGRITLRNRLIRAAVKDSSADGRVSANLIKTYRRLAQGGVGAIITGLTRVSAAEAESSFAIPALYHDDFIAGQRELTAAVHEAGAKIISQLVCCGSYLPGEPADGPATLAPSPVKHLKSGIMPLAISPREIKDIQSQFAQAAVRAQKAGYDGVELHAAHGFLLSQFLSPYYNRRSDEYGGAVENRARMLLETYESVRQAVGPDFQLWAKINVTDGFEGGVTLADSVYAAGELARRGLDALEVSGNFNDFGENEGPFFLKEAEVIATQTQAEVILTGGNRDCRVMTDILNRTGIAWFGLARPLIKEPDLINRWSASGLSGQKTGST